MTSPGLAALSLVWRSVHVAVTAAPNAVGVSAGSKAPTAAITRTAVHRRMPHPFETGGGRLPKPAAPVKDLPELHPAGVGQADGDVATVDHADVGEGMVLVLRPLGQDGLVRGDLHGEPRLARAVAAGLGRVVGLDGEALASRNGDRLGHRG